METNSNGPKGTQENLSPKYSAAAQSHYKMLGLWLVILGSIEVFAEFS
jgi:hypothetical protein